MNIIISWLLSAAVIGITAYLLPGVSVGNYLNALLIALVLGLLNAFIRPLLLLLTLPINILTLGLFTLVINAVIILLSAAIIPNFKVNSFWDALVFGIVLTILNYLLFVVVF